MSQVGQFLRQNGVQKTHHFWKEMGSFFASKKVSILASNEEFFGPVCRSECACGLPGLDCIMHRWPNFSAKTASKKLTIFGEKWLVFWLQKKRAAPNIRMVLSSYKKSRQRVVCHHKEIYRIMNLDRAVLVIS